MTAFAFDLAPDQLAIAADTAAYTVGAEARLTGFTSKCLFVPRLRMALCGWGIIDVAANSSRGIPHRGRQVFEA